MATRSSIPTAAVISTPSMTRSPATGQGVNMITTTTTTTVAIIEITEMTELKLTDVCAPGRPEAILHQLLPYHRSAAGPPRQPTRLPGIGTPKRTSNDPTLSSSTVPEIVVEPSTRFSGQRDETTAPISLISVPGARVTMLIAT